MYYFRFVIAMTYEPYSIPLIRGLESAFRPSHCNITCSMTSKRTLGKLITLDRLIRRMEYIQFAVWKAGTKQPMKLELC